MVKNGTKELGFQFVGTVVTLFYLYLLVSLVRVVGIQIEAAHLTRPFIKEATQKGQIKEYCMLIKPNQNISSQSFLRRPSSRK